MARLIFQLGDGKTVEFELSAAVVTLGRSTSNDIVINNGWISSHHAKFERSGGSIEVTSLGTLHGIPLKEYKRVGGEYTVTDLDSHNGVTVNGKRIKSQLLRPGDVLAFGLLEARFEDAVPPSTGSPTEPDAAAGRAATPGGLPLDPPLTAAPKPVTQRLVKKAVPVPTTPIGTNPTAAPPAPPPPSPEPPAPLPPAEVMAVPPAPPAEPPPPAAPALPAATPPEPPAPPPSTPAAGTPEAPAVPATAAVVPPTPSTPNEDAALPPPVSAQSALASLQRDVALLEKSLGALQHGAAAAHDQNHGLARGLIQRIDQLEDLMAAGEKALPGLADRLAPLHASLLELLREHSIEPYTVPPGQPLDVATRKRITIVEAAPEGEGVTEVAEVFRPGYQLTQASAALPAVILRKAEVRTLRRPQWQVT